MLLGFAEAALEAVSATAPAAGVATVLSEACFAVSSVAAFRFTSRSRHGDFLSLGNRANASLLSLFRVL